MEGADTVCYALDPQVCSALWHECLLPRALAGQGKPNQCMLPLMLCSHGPALACMCVPGEGV